MKLQDYLEENVKKDPDGLFLISGEKRVENDGENIKDRCNERMASLKAPDLVEFISALPKDASGKVIEISLLM